MNEEKDKKSNMLHYLAYSILSICLLVSVYFNLSQEQAPFEKDMNIAKCDKFENLPPDIQSEYTSKEDFQSLKNTLADLSGQKKLLLEQKDAMKQESETEEPKTAVPLDSNITMAKDFAKCYNMDLGSYIINYQCKKNISNFIDKHKDAKYFEIIGIVDEIEFKLYKNLQNNDFIYENLGVTQKTVEYMKKLTDTGLAKHRAIEAIWVIKAHAGRQTPAYNTNYKLLSKDGKRGVIVRAYK